MLLRRIVVLVTAGLAMAAMMALGAGAALADKGGGGHTECDDNTGICQFSGGGGSREGGGGGNAVVGGGESSFSGGGGSREGGGGGHFHVQGPIEDQQITSSGGSGGKDGGGGGMCEAEYNGKTNTLNITEERGSSAPYACKS